MTKTFIIGALSIFSVLAFFQAVKDRMWRAAPIFLALSIVFALIVDKVL